MTKYKLVNPHIEGNINTSIKAKSELKAAGKIYDTVLSPLFLTSIPKLNFTIKGGNNYYHYTVTENVAGNKIKYKIQKFEGEINNDKLENLKQQLSGGKHKRKDDSSSSSSSSDSPPYYSISKYCYSPYVYNYNSLNYSYYMPIFTPTYVTPLTYVMYYY
jgi:hypothetical protein